MKTEPYVKPLKQPYEEVYVSYKDGDAFIYKPRQYEPNKLTRLCLPANYANNQLRAWNQEDSKSYGSPWRGIDTYVNSLGKVGCTLINSGSEVSFWSLGYIIGGLSSFDPCGYTTADTFNWSLDKTAKKFSFEFYLDNDREESNSGLTDGQSDANEICIYDDDETFWTSYVEGAGSVGTPVLEEETVEVKKGGSSLKITVPSGAFARAGAFHQYDIPQNFSTKEFIAAWLYGANTGGIIRIAMRDGTNYCHYDLTDNWVGWRRCVIPRNQFILDVGVFDWATVDRIFIVFNTPGTYYLDRTVVDVGQWVRCEVYVPDILGKNYIVLWSWDGSIWQPVARRGTETYTYGHLLYFLDGTTQEDITGRSYGTGCGIAFFQPGERGETKNIIHGEDDPNAGNITYSPYYGCKRRLGFAIKMPPDDGQDSSTAGISQCKLKIEIRYNDDGKTSYEFEKSTNQYYGLDNINDSWLALFSPTVNLLQYLILNQRPLGLEVTADHNEGISQIAFTLKKGTRIWMGELIHGDHSRDTDGDGVPDILEEDYDPSIMLDLDFNNEDETENIAHDRSPNHNNGTIYGATWIDGKVGRALDYNGIDNYVDFGDILDFASGDEFTLEYWAKSSVNNRIVIDKGRMASPYIGWSSSWGGIASGKVDFSVRDGAGNTVNAISTTTVTTGGWFHIVGVRGKGRVKLYVNGALEADEADITGDLSNTLNLIFGANSKRNVGTWFDGIIDEVRVYNRVLSVDEIKERYNLGKLKRISVPRLVKRMGYAGW